MTPPHDPLLAPELIDGITSYTMPAVRELRAQCVDVETGLSYLRRMVQGSLDIVNRELGRRAGGRGPAALTDLIDELPEILGEVPRPDGVGRLPQSIETGNVDGDLQAAYDDIVASAVLSDVGERSAVELADLADRLTVLEREISTRRTAYHERIDALNAEIGRRYQSGEASVDDLLRERR